MNFNNDNTYNPGNAKPQSSAITADELYSIVGIQALGASAAEMQVLLEQAVQEEDADLDEKDYLGLSDLEREFAVMERIDRMDPTEREAYMDTYNGEYDGDQFSDEGDYMDEYVGNDDEEQNVAATSNSQVVIKETRSHSEQLAAIARAQRRWDAVMRNARENRAKKQREARQAPKLKKDQEFDRSLIGIQNKNELIKLCSSREVVSKLIPVIKKVESSKGLFRKWLDTDGMYGKKEIEKITKTTLSRNMIKCLKLYLKKPGKLLLTKAINWADMEDDDDDNGDTIAFLKIANSLNGENAGVPVFQPPSAEVWGTGGRKGSKYRNKADNAGIGSNSKCHKDPKPPDGAKAKYGHEQHAKTQLDLDLRKLKLENAIKAEIERSEQFECIRNVRREQCIADQVKATVNDDNDVNTLLFDNELLEALVNQKTKAFDLKLKNAKLLDLHQADIEINYDIKEYNNKVKSKVNKQLIESAVLDCEDHVVEVSNAVTQQQLEQLNKSVELGDQMAEHLIRAKTAKTDKQVDSEALYIKETRKIAEDSRKNKILLDRQKVTTDTRMIIETTDYFNESTATAVQSKINGIVKNKDRVELEEKTIPIEKVIANLDISEKKLKNDKRAYKLKQEQDEHKRQVRNYVEESQDAANEFAVKSTEKSNDLLGRLVDTIFKQNDLQRERIRALEEPEERLKTTKKEEANKLHEAILGEVREHWSVSAPPVSRTIFDRIPTNIHSMDMGGNGFCGYVAIDSALGEVDLERYCSMVKVGRTPASYGSSTQLAKYAASKGLNLLVICHASRNFSGSKYQQLEYKHNVHWKWVVLDYESHDEMNTTGHYRLCYADEADQCVVQCPYVKERRTKWYDRFKPFSRKQKCIVQAQFAQKDNADRRTVVERRDKLLYQDGITKVKTYRSWRFFGMQFWRSGIKKLMVSNCEAHSCFPGIQQMIAIGQNPSKLYAGVGNLREVNTDHTLTVISDTVHYLEIMTRMIKPGRAIKSQKNLTQVNAPGSMSVISDIKVIEHNQTMGREVTGGDECYNHIPRQPMQIHDDLKVNKVVGSFPEGPIFTGEGLVGAGMVGLTDKITLTAAFCGRSMNKESADPIKIQEFVDFSKGFLDKFIDGTDVTGLSENQDLGQAYKTRNKHKPQRIIDKILEEYGEHIKGKPRRNKKFYRHSAFVKFESNIKKVARMLRHRPRLIFTMSGLMSVECVQILDLIEAWNSGPFGRFQVKHLTQEEMSARIEEICRIFHIVTDFSAFESSINYLMREIENYVMFRLCDRAGYSTTKRNLERFVKGERVLYTKAGKMVVNTRCSGDYWTSFGNGIVNVCLAHWSAHLRGETIGPMDMVAEGDDGLIRAGKVNPDDLKQVGIKFSSTLAGTQPGDCDFLRSRWMDGKRYLNIGRVLSKVMCVTSAQVLKRSKAKFILRCKGLSLHYLSPYHPVLGALVWRIGKLTGNMTAFKGHEKYTEKWGLPYEEYKDMGYPKEQWDIDKVDMSMRCNIAAGAMGFPPIPIPVQIALEQTFMENLDGDIYVGNLLSNLEEVTENVEAYKIIQRGDNATTLVSEEMVSLYKLLDDCFVSPQLSQGSKMGNGLVSDS